MGTGERMQRGPGGREGGGVRERCGAAARGTHRGTRRGTARRTYQRYSTQRSRPSCPTVAPRTTPADTSISWAGWSTRWRCEG